MGWFSRLHGQAHDGIGGASGQGAGADAAKGALSERRVRIRYRFVGTVQAVGFRWTTTNLADQAGATGWVRNEPDGSVTAEIQGSEDQVEAVFEGLDAHFNKSSWSGGFQVAAREYLPLVHGESSFRVAYR